jgi:photosystem II stability/assembly factor-like uncharacterized protein
MGDVSGPGRRMARRWLEHTADKRSASHTGRVLQMVRFGRRPVPIIVGIALLCALVGAGAYRFAFADEPERWIVVSEMPSQYVVPIGMTDHRDVRVDSGHLAVSAVDSRTAFVVGWYSDTDYPTERPLWSRTTNGVDWSAPTSLTAYEGRLRAVDALTGSNAWAVGDGGLVLKWTGSTWEQRASGVTTAQLNGVAFADASNGWIVGSGGTVLRTVDGGSTWTTPSVGFAGNLNAVSAAGPAYVMAVGAGGKCVRWDGTWWQSEGTGTTEELLSVDIVDSTHGLAVGAGGTFLRWQGDSWYLPTSKEVDPLYSNTVRGVTLSGRGTGVAVGDWGMVWRTADGGDNWWREAISTYPGGPNVDLNRVGVDIAPNDASRVWMTGDDPTVPPALGVVELHIARVYEGTLNYLPPDAPASLVATATAPGPAVVVRWNNVARAATDFEVERAKGTPAVWTPLGTAPATVGEMSFSDAFSGVPPADAGGATWYYRVRARSSRFGTSEWVVTPGLCLDVTPPSTIVSPAIGGWFTAPQTITFTTSDGATGSGVVDAWLRVGTGARTSARSYPAGEGTAALEWGSADAAGNIETTKGATVQVDVTDPVTTPTVGVEPVYWGSASIVLHASDNLSGIAATSWRLNAGVQTDGTLIDVTSPGDYTLEFHTRDVAGHVETTQTRTFRVVAADSAPPSGVGAFRGSPDWSVRVEWRDESDNETGFRVERARNATATWVPVASLGENVQSWADTLAGFTEDEKQLSTWYYRVRSLTPKTATDEWVYSNPVLLNTAAPHTRAFVGGVEFASGGVSAWGKSANVTLSVAPSDSVTVYRVGGAGDTTPYTSPFAIPEGEHVIEYRSSRAGCGEEPTRTITVRVDSTAPTGLTSSATGVWRKTTERVVLGASDAVSGYSIVYRVGAGAEVPYPPGGFDVSSQGTTTIDFAAIDSAGNRTEGSVSRVLIDGTAPVTTSAGAPASWARPDQTVTLSAVDDVSGVASIRYTLNGGVEEIYRGGIAITVEGTNTLAFAAIDVAGNRETTKTVTVLLDSTAPVTNANVGTVSRSALVLTPSDAQSGVGSTWYSVDGGPDTLYDPASPPATLRGVHSVAWWSIDKVGNTEARQYGTIVGGPQPSITTPKGSSSTRVRRTLTFSGKITRATNHGRLTLLAYWFDGSNWVLARTKSVQVHTPRRGLTTYRGSIKFTAKGTWLVYARFEGDAYWVQTWSAGKVVRVR